MARELLDYFDENYNLLGQAYKDETQSKGLWVHSFHCWMLAPGDNPSLLVQKRASTKKLFPDYLDISAAGHLVAGEKVEEGVREIEEEVGLKVGFNQLIPLGIKHDAARQGDIVNRQFSHVFLYPNSPSIGGLSLDAVELDGMVEIPVALGLKLFSGELDVVAVDGIEKSESGEWRSIKKEIGQGDFIPRVDNYYYKIFIIADLYSRGYRHLSI